ncbi:MAG TPA: BMC domain-containing protein, partial [Bacteroidota bacterium]|nr:BMC domain-containing protein [Bacteroidota bacterium]
MNEMNAIGLVELSSIAAGYLVADAMLKVSDVSLLLSRSICSGKYIVMIGGDVASVRSSVDAGTLAGTGMVIDSFVIPNVHAGVFPAIAGTATVEMLGALGIVESFSVASLVEAS